jgi:tetratricopeptide (TPR) repeat protein
MPIHEVLLWSGEGDEKVAWAEGVAVHHHPDDSKSRGQYLPMLERQARDEPLDPRAAHYLGREYYFWGRHEDAIRELERELALPGSAWPPQRAAACRMIGKCLDASGRPEEALPWYWKAVHERPQQREAWVDLCYALYLRGDFAGGFYAAERALAITEPAADYFQEPEAWGALPHDLLSVCAWRIGLPEKALEHARRAADFAPRDERIQANLEFLLGHRGRPT